MNLKSNPFTGKRTALSVILMAAFAIGLQGCSSGPNVADAAKSAPAPAWKQGMGADMSSSKLAPLAGKMTATPANEIPLNTLKLPPGFKIEVYATGIPGAREMAMGDNGKIYIGTRGIGRVYEVSTNGKERTSRVVVDKLVQPSGVAYKNGSLYVMAIDKVLRYDGIAKNPNVAPVDLTAKFNLPPEQHHNWKYLAFGPDGKLYVPFGAPCNICELPTPEYAQIRRYNPDGSGMEVIATGVRHTQGFDWHPVTKQLWFTNHGRDWMGDDKPNDTLNIVTSKGENFGFPYCHEGNMPDDKVIKPNACAGVTKSVALLGAHAAAMGIKFYTGNMFPAEYKGNIFIAEHGSWNKTKKSGYQVVRVVLDSKNKPVKLEPFITGWLDGENFWGRPVDVQVLKDGSMLVSDDETGAIFRVSYGK